MNTGHNFLNNFDNRDQEHNICYNYYTKRDDKSIYEYNNNITPISSIDNNYYSTSYYTPPIKVTEYRENMNKNTEINKNLYTSIEEIEKRSYPSYSIYNNKNLEKYDDKLNIKKDNLKNNSQPHVFGPPLWFILHVSSFNYPDNPSTVVKKNMEYIIKGLPVLIPCQKCKEHATQYIEKNIDKISEIVSSKKNIFEFFVDFHNYVNQRYNKKIMSYDEAYKLYSTEIVNKFTYK